MNFDVENFRKNFSQLNQEIHENPLIYFDNGASSLKHNSVSERINLYNKYQASNVHRGAHSLSQRGTELYEKARKDIASFIGASQPEEIIFTRGTTESINLVARSFVGSQLRAGDEILITSMEHHSNIVPWQMIADEKKLVLKVVPFHPEKGICFSDFEKSVTEKTRFVSFLWYSNSFGNRLPVEEIVDFCRKKNIPTLIDAAQVPLTERIDIAKIPCDFLCFSGHKMYAPYGVGALYGKAEHLEKMPPYEGGGSMIDRVSFDKTSYAQFPQKFEAGTPNISGAIGLAEAANLLSGPSFEDMHSHTLHLRKELLLGLEKIPGFKVYNFSSKNYSGVVSFSVDGAHPSDIGTLFDRYGIAVRSGHHCTQPLMQLMGIEGTVRASLAPYNSIDEVKKMLQTCEKIKEFF